MFLPEKELSRGFSLDIVILFLCKIPPLCLEVLSLFRLAVCVFMVFIKAFIQILFEALKFFKIAIWSPCLVLQLQLFFSRPIAILLLASRGGILSWWFMFLFLNWDLRTKSFQVFLGDIYISSLLDGCSVLWLLLLSIVNFRQPLQLWSLWV